MTDKTIKTLINALSWLAVAAGLFGMLFCFPFLWSSKTENILGAGLPFVGASVLFGSGIIALSVFYRKPSAGG